jgi:pentatricopeptide repeat protein
MSDGAFQTTLESKGPRDFGSPFDVQMQLLVQRGQAIQAAQELISRPADMLPTPHPLVFSLVIDQLLKERKHKDAEAVLDKMVSLGFHGSMSQLSIMVDMSTKARDLEGVSKYVELLANSKSVVSTRTLNSILTAYLHLEKRHLAMKYYQLFASKGVQPNSVTYGILMGVAAAANQPEEVQRLFLQARQSGLCDLVLYNQYLRFLAETGSNPDKLLSLYAEMQAKKLEPNGLTFGALLRGCGGAKDLPKAKKVWEEIHRVIPDGPDVILYNFMINVCNRGELHEAESLLAQMQQRGLVPTVITWNSLIKVASTNRNFKCAQKWYQQMRAAGLEPTDATYRSLISSSSSPADLPALETYLDQLIEAGLHPSQRILRHLMVHALKLGELEKAKRFLDTIYAMRMPIEPLTRECELQLEKATANKARTAQSAVTTS